jgi:mRNA-degrading endonuclease RelE of RelBE toxin-antitoxin system
MKRYNIQFEPEMFRELKRLAYEQDKSISEIIREIISVSFQARLAKSNKPQK